jgi:anaerobic selenocysteine-containing dehydrogenase
MGVKEEGGQLKGVWKKTHCARFDHGGCGLKVLVENGKAIRVLPDKSNPWSRGYVCPKGLASVERIYHPDRLRYPLKRVQNQGRVKWARVSWHQALAFISKRLKEIREESGAQAVAFAQGAPKGLEYCMMMRLANIFGSPSVCGTQHVCHWPRELMGRFTCGFLPIPDYDPQTQCVLLWGSNPFATNEEGILGIHLRDVLKNGKTSLIVVDPYRTQLAGIADLWLQIRPGADDLLALGFIHEIIKMGFYDHDFVDQWTVGFEALLDHVQPYSADAVSGPTWVSAEKIRQAAKLYAEASPALLHAGNAVENNGTNTAQTCRALTILMAITGNLDSPGGNIQPTPPNVLSLRKFIGSGQLKKTNDVTVKRYYGISTRLPLIPSSLMIKTINTGKPHPIEAMFLQGTNPLISYAGSSAVFEAMKKLKLLVVSDLFMTPTAAMADLVLPAATNLEYNDIGHYGMPHGYVLSRPKIVDSPGECWSDARMLNELGKYLGYEGYFWEDMQACLDAILAPSGLSYEEFCKIGVLKGKRRDLKYLDKGFGTPSGKVELYSSIMKASGYEPLPSASFYESRSSVYPLLMTSSKPRRFFHSGFRSMGVLRNRKTEPRVRVHPLAARSRGFQEGDVVHVITEHGRIRMKTCITGNVHPDVVTVDYGWWFPEMGEEKLFGWEESNLNMLTSTEPPFDPVLGTTALRAIPCALEKPT